MAEKKLIIKSERKKEIVAPRTKNGPKAIWLFRDFLPSPINIIPNMAPIIKANIKATIANGKLKNKPIKNANLASPRPMALPFEKK